MEALGKNAVLVSVSGGDRMAEVPAAKLNQDFVLGDKVMVGTVHGSREYFEVAVGDLWMPQAQYQGWVARLLTRSVQGLDNHQGLVETLTSSRNVIKAVC
jgi:hypothetical protein